MKKLLLGILVVAVLAACSNPFFPPKMEKDSDNTEVFSIVSAGDSHTIAIKSNGTLWAWGNNSNGQLGLGDNNDRNSPVQVGTDSNWVTISAGSFHTMAIKSNGTLWAWGKNSNGQLGLGDYNDRNSPFQVGTDTNWVSVFASSTFTIALKPDYLNDNHFWAWGSNSNGQLCNNGYYDRNTPGNISNWGGPSLSLSVGGTYVIAINHHGMYGWGSNEEGQFGYGSSFIASHFPILLEDGLLEEWSISAGDSYVMVIMHDGTLWAFGGSNDYGQLGLGDTINRNTRLKVGTDTDWATVLAGNYHTTAFKTDNSIWIWGRNDNGQLGLGDYDNRNAPVQVGTDTNWASISVGGSHTVAIKSDGTLWTWGNNSNGQLGLGNTINRNVPTNVN